MIRNASRRVLVVDDEPSVREMLSDFLEMNNFICMQADNGASAVDVTKREKFDLIIMDVRMPGVSGIEALREIKREIPGQAVVMVTAVTEVETAVEAMRLGANDYVLKPFVLHDMLDKVDEAITMSYQAVPMDEPEQEREQPITIAVGSPLDVEAPAGASVVDTEALAALEEEVYAIQEQLASLAARVSALGLAPARLKQLAGGAGPAGDEAA